jgi:integrase
MVWVRKSTKEERRKDRAAIGNLMDLLLTPRRALRNKKAANIFVKWAKRAGFPLNNKNAVLVSALCEWAMHLWNEGESKEILSDCLQSLKFLLPSSKLELHLPWKVFRKWSNQELPMQATPAARLEALAIAGEAFRDSLFGLGVCLLIAYDGFLRTGEYLGAKPGDLEDAGGCMILHLGETKGVKRRGGTEEYLCRDELLVSLLRRCLKACPADAPIVGMNSYQFRKWLRKTTTKLGLGYRKLLPYSFRRGGISAAVTAGVPLSTVVFRARWHSPKIAHVYVKESQQQLAALSHPPALIQKLKAAAKCIPRR